MAEFPYTLAPKNLLRFLSHIQKAGVPTEKVTNEYLTKSGFNSPNDKAIPKILEFIGFLDSSRMPTQLWKNYKDKSRAKIVLADNIMKAYSDLFTTHPDAYKKDRESLYNYFSAKTGLGDRAVNAMVKTFNALCDRGDFEAFAKAAVKETPMEKPETAIKERPGIARVETLNINIQLQLPATADESIYEKIFAALKKHLMTN
ncbi:hypothetical protein CEE39_06115 [bacterium (candidate division B38) B3_B38]|nr:MAG: hypothetical protein CEE39_06115 [bacterium (candidate division B38) B3_B38]